MKREITEYYNELANDYDQDRFGNSYGQYIHKQEIDVIERYLDKANTTLNLDIACGTGRFLSYADHGVDISTEMLAVAKRNYPSKNLVVGDAENLPFQPDSFQNATAFHLFMHLNCETINSILSEVHRVIRKDGYFLFDVPSEKRRALTDHKKNDWHAGNQISIKTIKEIIGSEWELIAYHGIAFFPIHRLSPNIRTKAVAIDSFLCNSFLKEYSSHLLIILKKR